MSRFFFSTYTKKMALFSMVAIFFILLDRTLKIIAKLIWSHSPVKVLSWFNLGYSPNSALAFSLPANKYFILGLIIFLLLILIVIFLKKLSQQNWQAVWWLIIILGASSNLIDRLLYGAVIDYFEVVWFTAFNLADCLITLGVGALLLQEFTSRSDESDPKAN